MNATDNPAMAVLMVVFLLGGIICTFQAGEAYGRTKELRRQLYKILKESKDDD